MRTASELEWRIIRGRKQGRLSEMRNAKPWTKEQRLQYHRDYNAIKIADKFTKEELAEMTRRKNVRAHRETWFTDQKDEII